MTVDMIVDNPKPITPISKTVTERIFPIIFIIDAVRDI